ncbi:MAG: type II toxin-antitoxin system RelE/ParE family toxin [Chloroflexi bacterium]|nr:type II toxin-antitoxin system RelE/ParE family toxin [Chloroflexota bacterium]
MDITFQTTKLKRVLNDEKQITKIYGLQVAKVLKRRLFELGAAETLKQISPLPPPRCHELKGDRAGQLSVELPQGFRLIFVPTNEPKPLKEDGGLDWSKVTVISIRLLQSRDLTRPEVCQDQLAATSWRSILQICAFRLEGGYGKLF